MGKEGLYHKPFGETSGKGESFSLDRPIDLVGNIRTLIQQERARQGNANNHVLCNEAN